MARRRYRDDYRNDEYRRTDGGYPPRKRKSAAEARIERFTWFLLVLVFGVLYVIPQDNVPNWVVPLLGAMILLGSGVYQYSRRWHVSPVTWMAGSVMLVICIYSFQVNDPEQNFLGLCLLIFAGVIGYGVLTGET